MNSHDEESSYDACFFIIPLLCHRQTDRQRSLMYMCSESLYLRQLKASEFFLFFLMTAVLQLIPLFLLQPWFKAVAFLHIQKLYTKECHIGGSLSLSAVCLPAVYATCYYSPFWKVIRIVFCLSFLVLRVVFCKELGKDNKPNDFAYKTSR